LHEHSAADLVLHWYLRVTIALEVMAFPVFFDNIEGLIFNLRLLFLLHRLFPLLSLWAFQSSLIGDRFVFIFKILCRYYFGYFEREKR